MTNDWQGLVREFHSTFNLIVSETPTIATENIRQLRERLIDEEATEFIDASLSCNLPLMADALADIIYVTLGAAVSFGIDLDPIFREVHRSNMSKVGGYLDDGGKWVKPDTYSPADIKSELIKQGWTEEIG